MPSSLSFPPYLQKWKEKKVFPRRRTKVVRCSEKNPELSQEGWVAGSASCVLVEKSDPLSGTAFYPQKARAHAGHL